jgi:RimJ/RimL family protein N-acetyltransferase
MIGPADHPPEVRDNTVLPQRESPARGKWTALGLDPVRQFVRTLIDSPPEACVDVAPLLPLTTDRLSLRLFAPGDVDDLYAYQNLPSVAKYLYRPPHTRERSEQVAAERATQGAWRSDGDKLSLAVCLRDRAGVLGEVSVTLASAHASQAEIGWTLDPRHEGHGYATEAATRLAAFAFDTLGAHRLFARLDVENTGSVRVCERLGMRREAHFIENDLDGERWGSEYVYAVLRSEFKRG